MIAITTRGDRRQHEIRVAHQLPVLFQSDHFHSHELTLVFFRPCGL